ncbi:hypothetical protein AX16_003438 [Volvariella volvacea WC 439]|nr:hypothetical protein AX16_003438 [Volvariella volvacea WC 439]
MRTTVSHHNESIFTTPSAFWRDLGFYTPILNLRALTQLIEAAAGNTSLPSDASSKENGKKRAAPEERAEGAKRQRIAPQADTDVDGGSALTAVSASNTLQVRLPGSPQLEFPYLPQYLTPPAATRSERVHVFHHTFEVQYTSAAPNGTQFSRGQRDQIAAQLRDLISTIEEMKSGSSDPQTIPLTDIALFEYHNHRLVATLQKSNKWLALLPTIDGGINLEDYDYTSPVAQDLMTACLLLHNCGRAHIQGSLNLLLLPDGAYDMSKDELPFRLQFEFNISIIIPVFWVAPNRREVKKRVLELEDCKRRLLDYVFPARHPVPDTFEGQTDISYFYSFLQPAPHFYNPALQDAIQPPELNPTLLPFQRRSVGWLLEREGKAILPTGEIISRFHSPSSDFSFWQQVGAGNYTWWYNRLSGELSPNRPEELDIPSPYGAILAEEPGLGKTVEMIALIMSNPAPPERNPSVSRWDPESKLDVKEVKTTLVVTPPALASQWVDELATHAPSLRVMVYDGWTKVPVPITKEQAKKQRAKSAKAKGKGKATSSSSKSSSRKSSRARSKTQSSAAASPELDADDYGDDSEVMDWCTYAHSFDVVITTYNVLRNDLGIARAAPERPRRSDVKYTNIDRPRSPLVMCEWNRVIMDEVQMVGGGKAEDMVSLIPRLSSFAVSGTPARTQVADLIRVLRFLRVDHVIGSAKLWQRLLLPAFAGDLAAFFQKYAIRTMKSTIKDELTVPTQTRYLVRIELGPVERHVYDHTLETALLGLGLDSRGVTILGHNGWEVNSMLLRTVLRNLRGICTHPQVGQLQAKNDKTGKPNALKTMEEVLEAMRDTNWKIILDDAKSKIQSVVKRSQLVQKDVYDQQRYHDAVALLIDAEKETQQIINEIEDALREHGVKGEVLKQKAKEVRLKLAQEEGPSGSDKGKGPEVSEVDEDDFGDDDDHDSLDGDEDDRDLPRTPAGKEHRNKKQAIRQRLREFQLVLHQIKFLQGDAYHVLGGQYSKDEDGAYTKAEELRRILLKTTEQEAERAMESLASNAKRKQLSLQKLLIKTPFLTEYGIRSNELVTEFNELVEDILNPQAELLWEWRDRLTALLTDKVASGSQEADGQEYQRTLDAQGEAESYMRAYSALLADMREALVNERTLLAAHDVREKNLRKTQAAMKAASAAEEGREMNGDLENLELQPEYEVLYKELSDKRKELLEDLEGRAVKSVLVEISNVLPRITKDKDPEKVIVKNIVAQIRSFMNDRTALLDTYEADLNLMRRAFNQRVLYFRQLQEISDSVMDVTWDGSREAAVRECLEEEKDLTSKLTKHRARQRYLDNLTKQRDEGRMDEEDEACVLCRCEFVRGYITQCAHIYCEGCMKLWLGRGGAKTCPVCRVMIDPGTIQRFTTNEAQAEAPKQPVKGEMIPQSRRKIDYNIMDPQLFKDIQSIESYGDYGTKIQTMVRHLRYLKFTDPGAKSIVFSAWADSLTIMEVALKSNGIPCIRIDRKSKGESATKVFKNDPSILVLLLHGERENAGLNVTCASRVFLMESVVHHGFELQAIARIDRMGQQRQTEVYCYYAEDTVERNILDLAARRGLSLYTKTASAGAFSISNFARDEVDQKTINKQVKKSGQKGDFIFRIDDMLAILFPHLYEDIEYLLPEEDGQATDTEGDVVMRDPSLGSLEHAVAGPSTIAHSLHSYLFPRELILFTSQKWKAGIGQTIKNVFKDEVGPHGTPPEDRVTSTTSNPETYPRGTTGVSTTSPTTEVRQSGGYGVGANSTSGATTGVHETASGVASKLPPGTGPGTTGKSTTDYGTTSTSVPSTRGYDTTGSVGTDMDRSRGLYTEDRSVGTTGAHPGTGTVPLGSSSLGTGVPGATTTRAHNHPHLMERRASAGSVSSEEEGVGRRRRASESAPRTLDTSAVTQRPREALGMEQTHKNFIEAHESGHTKFSSRDAMPSGRTIEDSSQLNPVTHERVRSIEYEEYERHKEHERHIHHVQHHIQPVTIENPLPETSEQKRHPVTRVKERHANRSEDAQLFDTQLREHQDSVVHLDKERAVLDKGVAIVNEHVHHHIHHVIQPVIQKETIHRHRIHTIIPTHEVVHEAPIIHQTQTHEPITMEHFLEKGGEMSNAFTQKSIASKVLSTGSCIREVEGTGERLMNELHMKDTSIDYPTTDVGTTGQRLSGVSGSQGRHLGTTGTGATGAQGTGYATTATTSGPTYQPQEVGVAKSLHLLSLHGLFSRNEVFKSGSVPRPPISSSIKQYYPSTGTSVVLTNKTTLLDLRLALPFIFEGHHITGFSYTFTNAPFIHLRKEFNGVGRFLAEAPIAQTLEGIILDFRHVKSRNDSGWSHHSQHSADLSRNTQAFHGLLNLFNEDSLRKRLSRLVSLSILSGDLRDGIAPDYHIVEPNWIRSGSNLANLTQTLTTIASIYVRPRSQTTGLHTLNLHTAFIFYDSFINWTFDLLAQHSHAIRSLSFYNADISIHYWPTILSHITLPNLEELYLGRSFPLIGPLSSFLVRHRLLKILDLGNNIRAQADTWQQPPLFLPRLTTLKGTFATLGLLLHPKFGSSLPLPSLQNVILVLFSPYLGSTPLPEDYRPRGAYMERLNSLFLTLQIHIGTQTLEWLGGRGRSTALYEGAKGIEFILNGCPQLLETDEAHVGLANWLSRFCEVTKVEFVDCNPTTADNWAARKELFGKIRAKNPKVNSLVVNGVNGIQGN